MGFIFFYFLFFLFFGLVLFFFFEFTKSDFANFGVGELIAKFVSSGEGIDGDVAL